MVDIKLVLTDMDGTIVKAGSHEVSESVREAVIACENRGIKVAAVTGRPYEKALPSLEILGFDGLCVFDNGASIRDVKSGELVWSKWLDAGTVRQIAGILVPDAIYIDYAPQLDLHEPADNELDRIAAIAEPAPYVFVRVPIATLPTLNEQLDQINGITYYNTVERADIPGYRGIQVNHIEADKFHGVAALRSINGISYEETLAIGDDTNDLAFFRNAGLTIAMGNAHDDVKQAADYTVADIDHDGFVEAMNRFVLD